WAAPRHPIDALQEGGPAAGGDDGLAQVPPVPDALRLEQLAGLQQAHADFLDKERVALSFAINTVDYFVTNWGWGQQGVQQVAGLVMIEARQAEQLSQPLAV